MQPPPQLAPGGYFLADTTRTSASHLLGSLTTGMPLLYKGRVYAKISGRKSDEGSRKDLIDPHVRPRGSRLKRPSPSVNFSRRFLD